MCLQEFLKGGALSSDRLIEERAPPVKKPSIFVIMLHLMALKSHYKNLLVVSGGEQMHFEFMTKFLTV